MTVPFLHSMPPFRFFSLLALATLLFSSPSAQLLGAGAPLTSVAFPQETILTTSLSFAVSIVAADFDGDGRPDVAAASLRDSQIFWYRNKGDGTFSGPITVSNAASGPCCLVAADLDGDGRVDLVSASVLDDKVAWYRNVGGASGSLFGFTSASPFANQRIITKNADYASSVAVADVDGDGLPDVVSASILDNKIAWYRNRGGGNFAWSAANALGNQKLISTAGEAPSCVVAGDLDGDGRVDLAVTSINDDTLAWFKGSVGPDGAVTFTRRVLSTTQLRAQAVSIADLNGDGRPDLLCAAPYAAKITYFRNVTADLSTRSGICARADHQRGGARRFGSDRSRPQSRRDSRYRRVFSHR